MDKKVENDLKLGLCRASYGGLCNAGAQVISNSILMSIWGTL